MKLNFLEYFRPEPLAVLGDRYSLVEKLSLNGLGQTFLGQDLHAPGHPDCIVKQFQLPAGGVANRRAVRALFQAEVRGRSRLSGQGCVSELLAHFETDREFYLVEEKVEGHSLAEELASPVPWPDQRVVGLLNDLLSTLEYIHRHRVVHLNLQPSNLIRRCENSRLTIISFGSFQQAIARAVEPTASVITPLLFNTSLYMPDEQIAGHAHASSDLYAVGLMAVQALTGCRPEAIPTYPQTREFDWRSLASLKHPALLDLLDYLVRYNFRTRCRTASAALTALSALPPEVTWFVPVNEAATNPQVANAFLEHSTALTKAATPTINPVAPAAGAAAGATTANAIRAATQAAVKKQQLSRQPVFRRIALPVGGGILALLSIGALMIWRAPNPVAVSEGFNSVDETSTKSTLLNARTKVALLDESVNSADGATGSMENASGSLSGAAPSASKLALAPEAAKATVNRFYDSVGKRSWDSARSLLSDSMAQRLEPDFFYQFQAVSVENLRIINQTPETADLVVQNTYVYLDGSSQQEERNYTVQIVDNRPTIVDTAFVEILKDRGYAE